MDPKIFGLEGQGFLNPALGFKRNIKEARANTIKTIGTALSM